MVSFIYKYTPIILLENVNFLNEKYHDFEE